MNQGSGGSGDTTAVTVYRVLLTFYGNNSFYENFGGGISLLSSRMDVRREVIFDGNRAVFGAGMAMSGRSLVSSLHPCMVPPTCESPLLTLTAQIYKMWSRFHLYSHPYPVCNWRRIYMGHLALHGLLHGR